MLYIDGVTDNDDDINIGGPFVRLSSLEQVVSFNIFTSLLCVSLFCTVYPKADLNI